MRLTGHTQLIQPPESVYHDVIFDLSDAEAGCGWFAKCRRCGRFFEVAVEWINSECA